MMIRSLAIAAVAALPAFCAVCSGTSEEDRISRYGERKKLSLVQAEEYSDFLLGQWKDSLKTVLADEFNNKVISMGEYSMKIDWTIFGEKPRDGRSLYISLHGGGGAPPELNDQQWDNQKRLYKPEEGVYLCPRAITNTWDLHFRPESDAFYDEIIHMAEAFLDVNPDKVYLMGYSAGGDGVWRLAPRMADTWAAASMMAGHPGDVSLVNLRNLPFMIWCGELDSAYERNLRCAERIAEMDSLRTDDPDGYVHEGHIMAGKAHWMDLEDKAAVPWMAKYTRSVRPERIIWKQGDVMKKDFYWIGIPENEASKGKEVRIHRDGNTITVDKCDYSSLTVYLDDKVVDLEKPLRIIYGDKTLFDGKVNRSPKVMRETLSEREDPSYIFCARITVTL